MQMFGPACSAASPLPFCVMAQLYLVHLTGGATIRRGWEKIETRQTTGLPDPDIADSIRTLPHREATSGSRNVTCSLR